MKGDKFGGSVNTPHPPGVRKIWALALVPEKKEHGPVFFRQVNATETKLGCELVIPFCRYTKLGTFLELENTAGFRF